MSDVRGADKKCNDQHKTSSNQLPRRWTTETMCVHASKPLAAGAHTKLVSKAYIYIYIYVHWMSLDILLGSRAAFHFICALLKKCRINTKSGGEISG